MRGVIRHFRTFVLRGLLAPIPEADARDPGWTVEEALQAVISGGLIGPDRVGAPAPPSA